MYITNHRITVYMEITNLKFPIKCFLCPDLAVTKQDKKLKTKISFTLAYDLHPTSNLRLNKLWQDCFTEDTPALGTRFRFNVYS